MSAFSGRGLSAECLQKPGLEDISLNHHKCVHCVYRVYSTVVQCPPQTIILYLHTRDEVFIYIWINEAKDTFMKIIMGVVVFE